MRPGRQTPRVPWGPRPQAAGAAMRLQGAMWEGLPSTCPPQALCLGRAVALGACEGRGVGGSSWGPGTFRAPDSIPSEVEPLPRAGAGQAEGASTGLPFGPSPARSQVLGERGHSQRPAAPRGGCLSQGGGVARPGPEEGPDGGGRPSQRTPRSTAFRNVKISHKPVMNTNIWGEDRLPACTALPLPS